jgi:hypothetical protein
MIRDALYQARFPLQNSYKADLREYYGSTVELVPLDFTRQPFTP